MSCAPAGRRRSPGSDARGRRVLALLAITAATGARGDVFTPVASYEPAEATLSVVANGGDAGLSVSIVQGGVGGAPAATDGDYVLKITINNEADGKIEFRHFWTASAYDLAGNDQLLADVYIASAGALPGLMGIWSPNWSPPDNWQQATGIPTTTGVWKTISLDVSARSQTNLDQIWAFIFEDMAGTSGVAYVDNLRLRAPSGPEVPIGVAANGLAGANEVWWSPVSVAGIEGYNVYRAAAAGGPYEPINVSLAGEPPYVDPAEPNSPALYYAVTSVVGGVESDRSNPAAALYNGMSDDEMLDMTQEAAFGYFWDGGHPVSGMAREGLGTDHPADTVTIGGTGFGLMTIVVGAERGFVTRAAAADRVLTILTFLQESVARYHGAWAHHYNGTTGATIPFAGPMDNGGDLVETGFLVQGMLTVRQYFDDPNDPVEAEIRSRATTMWEEVEWDWYRRFPGGDVLYWHWSPDFEWAMNLHIRGYNEAMIIYLLAIASPTHPMPPSSYANGFAGLASYVNGSAYYGIPLDVGPPFGGPLFYTHYSNLGFDPRYKRDAVTNYFVNAQRITRINRQHCIVNPNGFEGYGPLVWGLTASRNPWGYLAHSPTDDNGTITPTACVSAMPYSPRESLAGMRHLFDEYGADIWGTYGFVDAFNLEADWFDQGWLAIDQGTIATMIENHRTGLLWKLFMANPEIAPMMTSIGVFYEVDFDTDGDIDFSDASVFLDCLAGADVETPPPGCTQAQFSLADLDNDGDADMSDAAVLQSLFTGP